MRKLLYILPLLLLLIIPVFADESVVEQWNKSMGYCVTYVDTNYYGTMIYAGLGNGSIFAYSRDGTLIWANSTNTSSAKRAIKKIVSDPTGNIVWISEANQTGYISYSGTVSSAIAGTKRNITDVGMSGDGSYYVTTELNAPRITIRTSTGTTVAENTSGVVNWTKVGLDPDMKWMVTANQSDDILYFWNISTWNGWQQYNPNHTPFKNASQEFLDKFPYRYHLNITPSNYDQTITFKVNVLTNTTTTGTFLYKVNDTFYEYRSPYTGTRFFFTPRNYLPNASNTSDNQSYVLNMSYYYLQNYTVSLRNVSNGNFTLYMGCTTYTPANIGTYVPPGTSMTVNYTSDGTWVRPSSTITSINYAIQGGGGGGGSAGGSDSGYGGNAGAYSTGTLNLYSGQITVPIYVGAGGAGGTTDNPGSTGGATAINGTATSAMSRNVSGGTGGASNNPSTTAGTGATGSVNTTTKYAENGNAGISWDGAQCALSGYSGGTGGNGYGGGGGGGGYSPGTGCYPVGGDGAGGIAKITYTSEYSHPTTSTLSALEYRDTATTINQSSQETLAGNIVGISVPANGGLASISTDTILYQQYISETGFGAQYSATLSSGAPATYAGEVHDVKSSNSGVASIEGRGAYGLIYDSGGVAKASSLTGGNVRSVDTAMSAGTVAALGGEDGKLYVLSREGSSTWYSLYTDEIANSQIDAVAVTWDGLYVVAGRFNGTLQFFNTSVNTSISTTPTPSYTEVHVKVWKDAAYYGNQSITVYSSSDGTSSWTVVTDGITDSTGNYHLGNTVQGTYYKFVVNDGGDGTGEGSAIWQSNTVSTTVNINILSPSLPYQWNAYLNETSNNITVVYSDSTSTINTTVAIKDLSNGTIIAAQSYYGNQSFTYTCPANPNKTGSYQVILINNRVGAITREIKTVTSEHTFGIPLGYDKYLVYGVAVLVLMIIAGLFTAVNAKRGAFVVVIIAAAFMVWQFLPWTMAPYVALAGLFALLALFSAGSRKGD